MNETRRIEKLGSVPSSAYLRKSYDTVPYRNLPKPFTHISRLSAIAAWRGLTPAPPKSCRVLELGCADGGNLLPMAADYPGSQFVGIDLSPVQVDMGRQAIRDLSLDNFELRTNDILELGADDLERFDYIIVDGVFSWVPSAVQERILAICRDHLEETGIAFVSYNTYPGWHGKQALGELMRYHTNQISDPRDKAVAAQDLIHRLANQSRLPDDPAALLVHRLQQDLEKSDDPITYLVHEYLIDTNQPLYFKEFLDRIEAFALQYVDDAYPASTAPDRLVPELRQWVVERYDNYKEQQQYVDFLANVAFRRSLLCHGHLHVDRKIDFGRLQSLHAVATCRREESQDDVIHFRTDAGRKFCVEHSGLQMALDLLAADRPASMPVAQFRDTLGEDVTGDEAADMVECAMLGGALEVTFEPRRCTRTIDPRPCLSPLCRHQLSTTGLVTTAAHRPVRLENDFQQQLAQLLDGTHTVGELTSLVQQRVKADKPLSAARWDSLVRDQLEWLAERGLLQQA